MKTIIFASLALLGTHAFAFSVFDEPSVYRCVTRKTALDGSSVSSRFWSVGLKKKRHGQLHNFDGRYVGELAGRHFSVTLGENVPGRVIMYIMETDARESSEGPVAHKDVDDLLTTSVEYSDTTAGKIVFQCERSKP